MKTFDVTWYLTFTDPNLFTYILGFFFNIKDINYHTQNLVSFSPEFFPEFLPKKMIKLGYYTNRNLEQFKETSQLKCHLSCQFQNVMKEALIIIKE